MASKREQLESVIRGLEAQRGLLGDAFVDAGLAPLRARLSALMDDAPAASRQNRASSRSRSCFVDVVGSTPPQPASRSRGHPCGDGRRLARCTAIVAAHRGKVLQYAGDSLLAVFGADEAREDDAERAVRCGLALLAEGRELGDEVRRQHGHDGFDVRVGIHTGGVLLGGGVDAEGSIRGIAVNIAARMEQTAPAGALRISHDTYRHVRGVFDVEPQAPIAVKGVDEPIATYLVLRAKPRAFRIASRGIEGVDTRMIGRDAELAALQRRLQAPVRRAQAGDGHRGRPKPASARAGCSTSSRPGPRPRPERVRHLPRPRQPADAQASPSACCATSSPGGCRSPTTTASRPRKRKIEAGHRAAVRADDGADMAEAHAHLLGHLIGIDFGDSRHIARHPGRLRGRSATAPSTPRRRCSAGSRAQRRARPVVLQLEDLHWADDGSLDFLNYLARGQPRRADAGARPDAADAVRAPRRLGQRRTASHRAHRPAAARPGPEPLLADELLKKLRRVPPALRELIAGARRRQPVLHGRAGQDAGRPGRDRHRPASAGRCSPEQLLPPQVPQTLTGVLQARLDGLPRHERLALQEASVIGHVFWDQALAALDAHAPAALPALVRRELALPRDADAALGRRARVRVQPPDPAPRHLRHRAQAQQARRCTPAPRTGWPATAARRANDFLGAAAEHYEQAGDSAAGVPSSSPAPPSTRVALCARRGAGPCRAGAGAARRRRHGGDGIAAAHGLALRWRLLVVRESDAEPAGPARRAARRRSTRCRQLADALDDDRARALAARRRSQFGLRTGDYATQESAPRAGDGVRRRAPATTSRGWKRSACWPTRWARRATSRRARRWPAPAWPRRARSACAASKASS